MYPVQGVLQQPRTLILVSEMWMVFKVVLLEVVAWDLFCEIFSFGSMSSTAASVANSVAILDVLHHMGDQFAGSPLTTSCVLDQLGCP